MNAILENHSNGNKDKIVFYNNVDKDIITIRSHLQEQVEFFNKGHTKNVAFRVEQLKKLKYALRKNEKKIVKAVYDDLRRSEFDIYISELGFVFQEIEYAIKKIKKFAKPRKVKTPITLHPAKSWIIPEPYGQVLIISPWNYPFQLIMAPLIGAISAGNVAVLKPSELSIHTSHAISEIISETFDPSYVLVVEGDAERTKFLLSEKFDHIFFTGGTETGKIVMEAASHYLTPVTLELGGKSPVIVNNDAPLDDTAKKIVWGKYFNAGQTCIAPDYLLVHKDIKNKLLERIGHYIETFYGKDPKDSGDYSSIINLKHFKRLKELMTFGEIIFGGKTSENKLYISPTVIDNVALNNQIMKEEIFGPLLPVVEFASIEQAVSIVKSLPKPLALYLYTRNKSIQNKIIKEISAGGVVINDNLLHVANYYLPFGGVGNSGMGAYHGKFSFDTFSHLKPVMKRSLLMDIPFRYPPHKRGLGLIKKIFR